VKRTLVLEGKVSNQMNLRAFPFDKDDLQIDFWTASTFKTLDLSYGSPLPRGRTYDLLPVEPAAGEGKWLQAAFGGHVADWEVPGLSTQLVATPASSNGQLTTTFTLRVHMLRKSSFYVWKVLLSLKTYCYPVDELVDRDQFLATTILASFAMLYVNSSFLPKTDFLTGIDKITKWGLLLQFATGLGCSVMALWWERWPLHRPTVQAINDATAPAQLLLFFLANAACLLPDY